MGTLDPSMTIILIREMEYETNTNKFQKLVLFHCYPNLESITRVRSKFCFFYSSLDYIKWQNTILTMDR